MVRDRLPGVAAGVAGRLGDSGPARAVGYPPMTTVQGRTSQEVISPLRT